VGGVYPAAGLGNSPFLAVIGLGGYGFFFLWGVLPGSWFIFLYYVFFGVGYPSIFFFFSFFGFLSGGGIFRVGVLWVDIPRFGGRWFFVIFSCGFFLFWVWFCQGGFRLYLLYHVIGLVFCWFFEPFFMWFIDSSYIFSKLVGSRFVWLFSSGLVLLGGGVGSLFLFLGY
jgi:hypothetical protein